MAFTSAPVDISNATSSVWFLQMAGPKAVVWQDMILSLSKTLRGGPQMLKSAVRKQTTALPQMRLLHFASAFGIDQACVCRQQLPDGAKVAGRQKILFAQRDKLVDLSLVHWQGAGGLVKCEVH
jgi:hypothetical protein